jgi:hypothetical protein
LAGREGSLDMKRIAALRAKGVGWKRIAGELGVGTIYRVALESSKTRERFLLTSATASPDA